MLYMVLSIQYIVKLEKFQNVVFVLVVGFFRSTSSISVASLSLDKWAKLEWRNWAYVLLCASAQLSVWPCCKWVWVGWLFHMWSGVPDRVSAQTALLRCWSALEPAWDRYKCAGPYPTCTMVGSQSLSKAALVPISCLSREDQLWLSCVWLWCFSSRYCAYLIVLSFIWNIIWLLWLPSKSPWNFQCPLSCIPSPIPCKLAEAAPGSKTHQLTALHCACHCSHTISHSQGLQRLCPTSDQKFVLCWHCHHPMAVQWVSLLVTGWIVPAHLWLCIPTLRFSPLLCLGQRLLKLAQVPNDYSEPLEKLSSKSSLLLSCQIRKSPDQLCVWQVPLPLHKTAIGSNPAAYPPLSSEPSPLQPPFFLSADLIPATLDAKDTKQTSGGMLCNCLAMLLHS